MCCSRWVYGSEKGPFFGAVLGGVLLASVLFGASTVFAQTADIVSEANATLDHEPNVAETTRVALKYFRIDPENFDGLREAARNRAWLPLMAAGYRFENDDYNNFHEQFDFEPRTNDSESRTIRNSMTIGAVWDFREVVFNASEVQVYGLIGVQRDIMLESIRTYYLRRQLYLRLLLRPPEDPLAFAALQMRVDEFTAILDVLTGGWFSEEGARRLQRKNAEAGRPVGPAGSRGAQRGAGGRESGSGASSAGRPSSVVRPGETTARAPSRVRRVRRVRRVTAPDGSTQLVRRVPTQSGQTPPSGAQAGGRQPTGAGQPTNAESQ